VDTRHDQLNCAHRRRPWGDSIVLLGRGGSDEYGHDGCWPWESLAERNTNLKTIFDRERESELDHDESGWTRVVAGQSTYCMFGEDVIPLPDPVRQRSINSMPPSIGSASCTPIILDSFPHARGVAKVSHDVVIARSATAHGMRSFGRGLSFQSDQHSDEEDTPSDSFAIRIW
jgi:hypothetical protein